MVQENGGFLDRRGLSKCPSGLREVLCDNCLCLIRGSALAACGLKLVDSFLPERVWKFVVQKPQVHDSPHLLLSTSCTM